MVVALDFRPGVGGRFLSAVVYCCVFAEAFQPGAARITMTGTVLSQLGGAPPGISPFVAIVLGRLSGYFQTCLLCFLQILRAAKNLN